MTGMGSFIFQLKRLSPLLLFIRRRFPKRRNDGQP
jgi:hypothetical protein